jgi:hypothetical protein
MIVTDGCRVSFLFQERGPGWSNTTKDEEVDLGGLDTRMEIDQLIYDEPDAAATVKRVQPPPWRVRVHQRVAGKGFPGERTDSAGGQERYRITGTESSLEFLAPDSATARSLSVVLGNAILDCRGRP